MKKKDKIQYVNKIQKEISNAYGYCLFQSTTHTTAIQELGRAEGFKIYKLKTKLLERILRLTKDTLDGSIFLLILNTPLSFIQLVNSLHRYTYNTLGKLKTSVNRECIVKPHITTYRPTSAYKSLEDVIKTKLTKGFIELAERKIILYVDDVYSSQIRDIVNELKLTPVAKQFTLLFAKLNLQVAKTETYDFAYCRALNETFTDINRLGEYLEVNNGAAMYLDTPFRNDITTKYVQSFLAYLPADEDTLVAYCGAAPSTLLEEYNLVVPKTKKWSTTNITSLLYVALLSKITKYAKLSAIFKDEASFANVVKTHYNMKPELVSTIYNTVFKVVLSATHTNTAKTETTNTQTDDFDDLF